ncbi:hypothetical protein D3C76_959740 [compost metagenome]
MLEGDVQVRQQLAFGHQRDHVVDVRVRVDVVQAHPHAHARQRLAQLQHTGLHRLAVPEVHLVAQIDAVGAGVLGDHQQFLDAGLDQALGFAEHVADRAADQLAAHRRDDAEAAAVVAAFGNLQVGVVARSQLDALRRHQVDQRVVLGLRRDHFMDGIDHLLVLLRTGDGQYARVHIADAVFGDAHAAGDDDLAVLGDGFADGVQRLGLGAVDEAAGVDHHYVGILIGGHDLVALHAQLGEDSFGIDGCLGAP